MSSNIIWQYAVITEPHVSLLVFNYAWLRHAFLDLIGATMNNEFLRSSALCHCTDKKLSFCLAFLSSKWCRVICQYMLFLNCESIFVVLFVIIKSYHCLTPVLLSGTRAQVSFTSTLQGDFIRWFIDHRIFHVRECAPSVAISTAICRIRSMFYVNNYLMCELHLCQVKSFMYCCIMTV